MIAPLLISILLVQLNFCPEVTTSSGGISKLDLRAFLTWAANSPFVQYSCLDSVATATPTAELEPSTGGHVQTDEEDMGMTYQVSTSLARSHFLGFRSIWET
jgi:hypothetical protein